MQKLEQISFLDLFDAQVRDHYVRIATALLPKNQMENPIGELVVRYTEDGQPTYKADDPGEIYKLESKKEREERELRELRDKQFIRYEEVRDQMRSEGDKRHIFLIPKGILVEDYRGGGVYIRSQYIRGNLSQDVLMVKEEGHLRMIPLIPEDKIIINYFFPPANERVREPIKDTSYRVMDGGMPNIDLTRMNLSSGEQLNKIIEDYREARRTKK